MIRDIYNKRIDKVTFEDLAYVFSFEFSKSVNKKKVKRIFSNISKAQIFYPFQIMTLIEEMKFRNIKPNHFLKLLDDDPQKVRDRVIRIIRWEESMCDVFKKKRLEMLRLWYNHLQNNKADLLKMGLPKLEFHQVPSYWFVVSYFFPVKKPKMVNPGIKKINNKRIYILNYIWEAKWEEYVNSNCKFSYKNWEDQYKDYDDASLIKGLTLKDALLIENCREKYFEFIVKTIKNIECWYNEPDLWELCVENWTKTFTKEDIENFIKIGKIYYKDNIENIIIWHNSHYNWGTIKFIFLLIFNFLFYEKFKDLINDITLEIQKIAKKDNVNIFKCKYDSYLQINNSQDLLQLNKINRLYNNLFELKKKNVEIFAQKVKKDINYEFDISIPIRIKEKYIDIFKPSLDAKQNEINELIKNLEKKQLVLNSTNNKSEITSQISSNDLSKNVFKCLGATWYVSYNGIAKTINHTNGMLYIAYLLKYRDDEVYASDLMQVKPSLEKISKIDEYGNYYKMSQEELDEYSLTKTYKQENGIEVITKETEKNLKKRLSKIEDEMQIAKDVDGIEKLEKLLDEKVEIEEILRKTKRSDGSQRKIGDSAEKARIRVTKAIKTAIKNIKNEHKSLGKHLENSIKTGTECSYMPDKFFKWHI